MSFKVVVLHKEAVYQRQCWEQGLWTYGDTVSFNTQTRCDQLNSCLNIAASPDQAYSRLNILLFLLFCYTCSSVGVSVQCVWLQTGPVGVTFVLWVTYIVSRNFHSGDICVVGWRSTNRILTAKFWVNTAVIDFDFLLQHVGECRTINWPLWSPSLASSLSLASTAHI